MVTAVKLFLIFSATLNMLENIHELQLASEIIWNKFISHVTMALDNCSSNNFSVSKSK